MEPAAHFVDPFHRLGGDVDNSASVTTLRDGPHRRAGPLCLYTAQVMGESVRSPCIVFGNSDWVVSVPSALQSLRAPPDDPR